MEADEADDSSSVKTARRLFNGAQVILDVTARSWLLAGGGVGSVDLLGTDRSICGDFRLSEITTKIAPNLW